ncbi:MAG: HAMP domain-containing histidine kinase, partial [Planctomycetes bacterium]|nr:HAMP domain-containing histidine kinase [Planctomycetota bacterium]
GQVVSEFLHHEKILWISIVDDRRNELVRRWRDQSQCDNYLGADQPMELASICPVGRDRLLVARPVVVGEGQDKRVVGAVRLLLDTQAVADRLRRAHTTVLLLACGVGACAIVLSHVLLRHVLLLPIRKLVRTTAALANGNLSTRAKAGGKDEIGALAQSFNVMAERIETQHSQLLLANERLEMQVRRRTDQLHRVNARLREEMAEREEFLRSVSHDLNAPLRNIAGMTAMLLAKWRDDLPSKVLVRLARIQANVATETELINELLELSLIRSRRQKRELVDMSRLLEQVRDNFEFELRQKNIHLRIGSNMPILHAEKTRLRQVFMNLIDNAIKYMGPGHENRIEVTYDPRDGEHVFHVADTGPGIRQEDQEQIFTVFRRGSDHGSIPGKGVGLTTVRTIVTAYQGRIWLDSMAGEGATFHVALPQATTRAPQRPIVPGAAAELLYEEPAGQWTVKK